MLKSKVKWVKEKKRDLKETAEAVAESTDLEKGVQDTEFLGL